MNTAELYARLDKLFPAELSCDWDNDGLMCCPNPGRTVRRVLLALDVTEAAAAKAVNENYDVIVTHHPMIFKPLRQIMPGKITGLIGGGVTVMSFHTRLDAADGGVNDVLAHLLGIENFSRFTSDGIGVIGEFREPISLDRTVKNVREALKPPVIEVIKGKSGMCRRAAVCGGDGKDAVREAFEAGADTYITGSMSYNSLVDAEALGMNIITAGHYYTEFPVMQTFADIISGMDDSIECTIYDCDPIHVM